MTELAAAAKWLLSFVPGMSSAASAAGFSSVLVLQEALSSPEQVPEGMGSAWRRRQAAFQGWFSLAGQAGSGMLVGAHLSNTSAGALGSMAVFVPESWGTSALPEISLMHK